MAARASPPAPVCHTKASRAQGPEEGPHVRQGSLKEARRPAFDGDEAGYHIATTPISIQTAIAIMPRFSVSETKPSGTFDEPPTQAHFKSRPSM